MGVCESKRSGTDQTDVRNTKLRGVREEGSRGGERRGVTCGLRVIYEGMEGRMGRWWGQGRGGETWPGG